MVSRPELRQNPNYQNALPSEQIIIENKYLPEARRYRRSFQIPLEIMGTVGMFFATYYLSKKGIIVPDPGIIRYGLGGLIGFVEGRASGLVIGTLAYETFSQEGDIRQFLFSTANHFKKQKL
jgi:hypothetical protein